MIEGREMIFLLDKDRFVVNERVRMKIYPKDNEEKKANKSSPKTGNPTPNSLNQLYPKNTAQYSTNHSGIKHAITTFLEKIRSETNRIQYPGINMDIASEKKKCRRTYHKIAQSKFIPQHHNNCK